MSDNNIRELFKMLDPGSFEAQYKALDSKEVEILKNEDIKQKLGVQIEIMSGRKREVIQARKAEEALELNNNPQAGMWA